MAAHRFFFSRRSADKPDERQQLMQSLNHTQTLINQAYRGFDTAPDGQLVESFVYEISSLQARYSYLLRRMKELEEAT